MKRVRFSRRSFVKALSLTMIGAFAFAGKRWPLSAARYDVTEKSIGDLQTDLVAGHVTSVEIAQAYLDRIAEYDQDGPSLNAVIYVSPNALEDARALDEERARRGPRGPLHGIPVLLKDNYDTMDMPTTGASLGLVGAVPERDAFQVQKLRRAGAVILGKANLHELALGLTTHSSLAGQTLNPYDLMRGPGGSSGGSGAAVAANFAAFAMGTDTAGSIRVPSSHNNIVGLRPSAGLSSRSGIIPFGHTQDTGGPMAKTVADIALVLDATVGYDQRDAVTALGRGKAPATYTSALRPHALQGARIGVLNQLFGDAPEDQEVGKVVHGALAGMRSLGATTVDVVVPDLTEQLAASNLLAQELKFYLRDYLQAQPGSWVQSLEELVEAGLISSTVEFFLVNVFPIAAQPEDYLESDDYKSRLAARETLAATMTRLTDDNRLDAIAYPITRRIAPLIGDNQIGNNASLAAQTGFPAINVPAGFTAGGFPVGVELLGRAFDESRLLSLAYSFEHATRHRKPPAFEQARPPASVPKLGASSDTGPGSISGKVIANGRNSNPPSEIPFEAAVSWSFNETTRQFGYDISLLGVPSSEIAGTYLHHRIAGENGGVAHVLAKEGRQRLLGKVVLTPAQADALLTGQLYISVLSKQSPLMSARADIIP